MFNIGFSILIGIENIRNVREKLQLKLIGVNCRFFLTSQNPTFISGLVFGLESNLQLSSSAILLCLEIRKRCLDRSPLAPPGMKRNEKDGYEEGSYSKFYPTHHSSHLKFWYIPRVSKHSKKLNVSSFISLKACRGYEIY